MHNIHSKFLHILYILELIITNRLLRGNEKAYYIKFIIFILFLCFSIIVHVSDIHLSTYKKKYYHLIEKYDSLFHTYIDTHHKKINLEKQIIDFDIPIHIKCKYIEYLISEKHTCSICLCTITKNENIFLTICGHLFHRECINHSLNNSDKCPYCRTFIPSRLTDNDMHHTLIIED